MTDALIVSLNYGSYPLHEEAGPLLKECGIPFHAVHDQESAREWITQHRPRLVLLDSHVPLKSPPRTPGSLGGLVGADAGSVFATTLDLARWINGQSPESSILACYSVRSGTDRATREAWAPLSNYMGMFAFPFAEGNLKKIRKLLGRLYPGATSPGTPRPS